MKNVFKRGSAKKSAGKDPKSGPDKDSPDNDSKGDSGPVPIPAQVATPPQPRSPARRSCPLMKPGNRTGRRRRTANPNSVCPAHSNFRQTLQKTQPLRRASK